jgi:hypothetical protein
MTCLPRNIGSSWPPLGADKGWPATPFVTLQGNLIQGSPFFVQFGLFDTAVQSDIRACAKTNGDTK